LRQLCKQQTEVCCTFEFAAINYRQSSCIKPAGASKIFMKKAFLIFGLFISLFAFSAGNAFAQKQIVPPVERDPILEADASHNLEVANNYFKLKKAYKAVIMRFEETFAAYPDYSKMDEFLYIAGMSSYYLSNNKGKQKITAAATEDEKKKYAPEKLREDATMYLTMLVQKYPNSKHKSDAEKILKELDK
jgi:outer membrane protein assembly factor BamD (BamD/ComL family)